MRETSERSGRMKVVIDIPDDRYNQLMTDDIYLDVPIFKEDIIATLPKDHGRLIDADVLSKRLQELADDEWNQQVMASKGLEYAIEIIDNATTIIEASEEGAVR